MSPRKKVVQSEFEPMVHPRIVAFASFTVGQGVAAKKNKDDWETHYRKKPEFCSQLRRWAPKSPKGSTANNRKKFKKKSFRDIFAFLEAFQVSPLVSAH
jgi:hypothetical protein